MPVHLRGPAALSEVATQKALAQIGKEDFPVVSREGSSQSAAEAFWNDDPLNVAKSESHISDHPPFAFHVIVAIGHIMEIVIEKLQMAKDIEIQKLHGLRKVRCRLALT